VFLWGQKQEYTLTWYGLFTKDNRQTEAVDMLYVLWNQKRPRTPTPTIYSLLLYSGADAKRILGAASDSIRILSGSLNTARVNTGLLRATEQEFKNPNNYRIEWKMLAESDDKKAGGDMENEATEITGFIKKAKDFELQFKAPAREGAYRLFVFIYYGNKVAYANIPLWVKSGKQPGQNKKLRFKTFNMQSFEEK
jgi:hypothetical protein